MSATSTKACVCTGVRWCAHCRDPKVRRLHRMDDALPLPSQLRNRPPGPGEASGGRDGIHEFDLDRLSAPGCPGFTGLQVLRDFLDVSEAEQLLREIEQRPFVPAQSGKLKQHHGAKVNFNKKKVNTSSFRGLPRYVRRIEDRLRERVQGDGQASRKEQGAACAALRRFETTDAFVLRYQAQDASNLDLHRDDDFAYGEIILDLSLESDSVLTFVGPCEPDDRLGQAEIVRVPLPARSLAVLQGAARYEWEHGVLASDIEGQRTSVTLRTLSEALADSEAGTNIRQIARRDLASD